MLTPSQRVNWLSLNWDTKKSLRSLLRDYKKDETSSGGVRSEEIRDE